MSQRPPSGGGRRPEGHHPPPTVRFPNVTSSLPPALDDPDDQRDTEKALSVPAPIDKNRAILTLIHGPDAGQVFPLGAEDLIGRDLDAQVRIDDPSLSRAHARIVRQDDGTYVISDLDSMNGTFVGPDRIQRRELVAGDRIQLGPKLVLRFAITDTADEMLQRQLFESSTRDHLTRVYNRRYLMSRLAAEIAHARRHTGFLSLLLIDLDRFKETNDTYGHLAGDAVLRAIGDRVTALIRLEDVFARFGGEEFVVLIRASGSGDAIRLGERLRSSIETMVVHTEGAELRTSISVGVGSLSELGKDMDAQGVQAVGQALIALADRRLLRAKSAGRNRVIWSDEAAGPEALTT